MQTLLSNSHLLESSCHRLNLICKRLSCEISTFVVVKDLDAGDPSYLKQTQQQTSYRKPTCYRATYQGLAIFDLYRPSCCELSILNQLSRPSYSKNWRLVAFTHSELNSKYRPPVNKIYSCFPTRSMKIISKCCMKSVATSHASCLGNLLAVDSSGGAHKDRAVLALPWPPGKQ